MIPIWKLRFWTDHLEPLLSSARAALPIAVLWSFFEQMALGTVEALAFSPVLLGLSIVMVALDTATGCYKVIQDDGSVWSTKAFGGMIDKMLKYAVVVLVFSGIAAAGERGELPTMAFEWIRDFGYLVVIVREGGSAIENLWGKPLGELLAQFRDTVSTPSE